MEVNMDILNELEWRGAINQVTDEEGLRKLTSEDKIALYCGTDPTGDSLHIGHLIPFMILKRFQLAGHHPVIIIGEELVQLVIHPVESQNGSFKQWIKFTTTKKH